MQFRRKFLSVTCGLALAAGTLGGYPQLNVVAC
jgi:hypothetical protein